MVSQQHICMLSIPKKNAGLVLLAAYSLAQPHKEKKKRKRKKPAFSRKLHQHPVLGLSLASAAPVTSATYCCPPCIRIALSPSTLGDFFPSSLLSSAPGTAGLISKERRILRQGSSSSALGHEGRDSFLCLSQSSSLLPGIC